MSKKVKVVLLHNILSPHVTPVFKELAKRFNLTVLYCAATEDNRKWQEKPKGFDYKILPNSAIKLQGKDLFTYFYNPTIFKELDSLRPNLIIISGWDLFAYQAAFLYAKLKKVKFILWSGSTEYESSWRRTVSKPLVKLIIGGADAYISYGTRAKQYLIKMGADSRKIFISFNTTDLKIYREKTLALKNKSQKIRQNLGIKKKVVILYYGQLIERKGVEVLLSAYIKLKKKYDNCALVIIGSGPLQKKLEKSIFQDKIKDILVIKDPGDKNMYQYFTIADIFVLPSLEEVWGLVINQAMSVGLPIITTKNVGASTDLVHKNGIIIPAADIQQLYLALLKLAQNNQMRNSFGKESLNMIRHFYPEETVKGCIEAIDSVLKV